MVIETLGDFIWAVIFSSLYMALAVYFIWFVLPAWQTGKDQRERAATDRKGSE